jgi:HEAT repeat protein
MRKTLVIGVALLLCLGGAGSSTVPQKQGGANFIWELQDTLGRSRDPAVRRQTLTQLNKVIDQLLSSGMINQLQVALRDKDEEVRLGAVRALAQLRPVVWEVELDLIRVMKEDESPKVRGQAAAALGRLAHRPSGATVVPHLLTALKRPENDKEVRRYIVVALGRYGTDAKGAVSALVEALQDTEIQDNNSLARTAARALDEIGPAAAAAVPALLQCIKSDDLLLRSLAIEALGGIGTAHPDVLPMLRRLLQEKEPSWYPYAAARALGRIGSVAKDVVPDLLALLSKVDVKSPDNSYSELLTALARIDPTAKGVVPAMTAILKNKEAKPELRQRVVNTLAKMGPAAKEAVPALIEELRAASKPASVYPDIVLRALRAIGAEAVPGLTDLALNDQDNTVRRYAIEVLGEIGPPAKAAVPALRQCLDSPDRLISSSAAVALKRIEKGK